MCQFGGGYEGGDYGDYYGEGGRGGIWYVACKEVIDIGEGGKCSKGCVEVIARQVTNGGGGESRR